MSSISTSTSTSTSTSATSSITSWAFLSSIPSKLSLLGCTLATPFFMPNMALAQAQSSPVATFSVAEVFSAEQLTSVTQAGASEQAAAPILAPTPTPTPSPNESKSPLSGSLAFMTDYRFRGISQTWRGAALQGGVEMALPHGLYAGTWLSNVSTNSYPQGQSLEHDIYGGWRGEVAPGWQLDTGLLHYRYPGARLGTAQGGNERFDTTEAYVGTTHSGFSAKWSIALTPYFGLRDSTAGSAFASALTPAGSSRGSQYLDLNYQQPLGDWATLGVHAGYTHVRNYSDVSYADWRVSLAKTWGIWTASAAWVGTSANAHYYSAMNSQGRMRSLSRSGWFFGLSAAF